MHIFLNALDINILCTGIFTFPIKCPFSVMAWKAF